jgi:hypothetical protein
MGDAGREEWLKGAKTTDHDPGIRCETMTDRERRQCILDAFARKHDDKTGTRQVGKSRLAEPGGPQLEMSRIALPTHDLDRVQP